MKSTRRSVQRTQNTRTRRSPRTFIDKIEENKICEIKNNTDRVSCGVYHFDCEKMQDEEYIRRLAKIATNQRKYFYEIFPWKMRCKERWKMFIALRMNETTRNVIICGWCSVRYEELSRDVKAAYIVEVSVRRKKETGKVDEDYKGMGISLLREIIEYTRSHGVSMIYLVPSNEAVKEVYISRLGMSEVPETSYLVKSISEEVSIQRMNDIITHKRNKEIEQESEMYEEGLRDLNENIRERFVKKVESLKMSLDDKIAVLGEIVTMIDDVEEEEIIDYINELE